MQVPNARREGGAVRANSVGDVMTETVRETRPRSKRAKRRDGEGRSEGKEWRGEGCKRSATAAVATSSGPRVWVWVWGGGAQGFFRRLGPGWEMQAGEERSTNEGQTQSGDVKRGWRAAVEREEESALVWKRTWTSKCITGRRVGRVFF
jgi:hypothetical protein